MLLVCFFIHQLKKEVMTEMKKWNMEEEVGLSFYDYDQDFVKCVDSLIESEYIQRNQNDSQIIEYS